MQKNIIAWIIGVVLLIISLLLEFTIHPHSHFGIDGSLFFNAWYGFLACIAIIIISKLLSFLKRDEDYYNMEDK